MKKEIIINATSTEIRVAITEDDRLAEIFLEVPDKERHVGSIYLGRVERVVQGMNAAFIDIGETQDAFLHFSDVGSALDEFKDLLDDKDDEDDDDEEIEKDPPSKPETRPAEGKERRNDRGRKDDHRRDGTEKSAEDRPAESREPSGRQGDDRRKQERNGRSDARPEGRENREGRAEGRDGRNGRGTEGRSEGRPEGRREGRGEGRSEGREERRDRDNRRDARPEGRDRDGRREDRPEGRRDDRREGNREERAGSREPQAEGSHRDEAPKETDSRREGRGRDDRRGNGRDRDRRDRAPETREEQEELASRLPVEPDTHDYDEEDDDLDLPEGLDEGTSDEEGGDGTDSADGDDAGGRRRRRKRGRRGGRGRNRKRNSEQGEGDERPEAGAGGPDIAGNNNEMPSLETPRTERNDRPRDGQRNDRRQEERAERRPDNREGRPAGDRDRDRDREGERNGERDRDRNRDRQQARPERSERPQEGRRDQRNEPERPQSEEGTAETPRTDKEQKNDRRDRHGRDRRRGNRWEGRREADAQETGERSEEPRAQAPEARREDRRDDRNERRPAERAEERQEPREARRDDRQESPREERSGRYSSDRRDGRREEPRREREEERPAGVPPAREPQARAEEPSPVSEPRQRYDRGENRRGPRQERERPAQPEAAPELPAPVATAPAATAPAAAPQENREEKPVKPARAPRASRAKKPAAEPTEAAAAVPAPAAEKTVKPARRTSRAAKPADTPPSGEAPAETPRPKRPSRAKRPRSGDDDAPVKGSTVDAKLPTFQTKRSGEVTIALEKGQDVIVQVTRESYASKGVRVTTKVSLPGRFLVLLPLDPAIGISRKVQNMKERRRLRRIAKSILPEGHGCIIRTVAQDKDEEVIKQDLMKLIENWREIEQKIKVREQPGLLYKDQSIANTVMRDLFTPDTNRVVIDNKALYKEIRDYVEWAAPQLVNKVELYSGQQPVFDKCGVEKELQRISERKIYIPSGGYIILDQTEAMMVIDVNSGRYAGKKDQELNSLRTNLESAREIARQIRLRDIGGLIVVDFIDLYDEKNRKKVYDELKKEMKKDRAKSVVLPMTQFGLVQMTRQRIRQQVVQTISEPCPICSGSGLVQSKSTVVRNIERWIQRFKEGSREFRLTLSANPSIIDYLTEGEMSRLTRMMLKYFVRIKVVPDDSLPVEEFHFHSLRSQSDITDKFADDNGSKKKARKTEDIAA